MMQHVHRLALLALAAAIAGCSFDLLESKKIEYQKERLGRRIELEVKNKYLEMQNTQQALSLQREAIQNTGELFRTTLQAYLEGKADFLRFLETLQSVNAFKSEYYDILFDYFVKKAELERAVGMSF